MGKLSWQSDNFEVILRLCLHFARKVISSMDRIKFVLLFGLDMIVEDQNTLNKK